MAPPGAPVKPSWAGQTPLLWQGGCPDVWSPKWGLSKKLSTRVLGGVHRLCAQVTQCLHWPEGICDPGQAGFPPSLMLFQVLCNWIGTEVVFPSPEVLRSRGESSGVLGGVHRLHAQGDPMLALTGSRSWTFLYVSLGHLCFLFWEFCLVLQSIFIIMLLVFFMTSFLVHYIFWILILYWMCNW